MKLGFYARSAASLLVFSAFITVFFPAAGTAGSSAVSPVTCTESQRREIWLTALDDQGSLIEDLRKEDLAIKEDKIPAEILNFEYPRAESLSVAIFIDTSASLENSLPGIKSAAEKFVQSLRKGKDRSALVTFSGEATVEQEFTTDLERLRSAIARVKFVPPPGYIGGGVVVGGKPPFLAGSTAIWDAISVTSRKLFHSDNTRRVILLFSDGEDTISDSKMRDAIRQTAINNIEVFSIGVGDEWNFGINRDTLRKLSEETGGRAFFPKKVGDLESIVRRLETELRSRYSITYCAAEQKSDKSARRVEIKLTNPRSQRSKVRLSYRRYM